MMEETLDEFTAMEEPDRGNPLTAELELPNYRREAMIDAVEFFKNCARIVSKYKGNTGFAHDCMMLALGWYPVLGVDNQTALAKKWGCTKASVNKLVKKFESRGHLNLPPAAGQRWESGCEKMSHARKEQLK